MNDISVEDFADVLCLLEPVPETGSKKVWYKSQKQHMVFWFQEQTTTGSGNYTRDAANYSARTCYTRLLNARALHWVAYALGENTDTLQAATAAVDAESNYRKQCSAFRSVIPFARILTLLDNPKGWRLDADLLPYLSFDDEGYPVIIEKKRKDAEAVIDSEMVLPY